MGRYGLLIDYEYCSGCRSCEVACKEEHGYPVGTWGIKVLVNGPWQIEGHDWNWDNIPTPTKLCDLCTERVSDGRAPTCVHHCLAQVMKFGILEELSRDLETKPNQVLFSR